MRPWAARAWLGAMALATAASVAVTVSPLASGYADYAGRRPSDVSLYRAEVERVQAGQGYYEAAAEELTERGYPTASLFNWRFPLPMWGLAQLPNPVLGKALLCLAALAVLVLGFDFAADEGGLGAGLLTAGLLCGALLPCALGDLYVMPALWSGTLIALSVCAVAKGRSAVGVLSGLAALFMRSLALPYCVAAMGYAAWRKRWREAAAWAAGLVAFGVYLGLHAYLVGQARPADPLAQPGSWIRWGGAAFVLSTAQVNTWLVLLPQWVTALYLVAALVGFAGWKCPAGQWLGIVTCLYLLAFSIVGQELNQYWGWMYAPLLCFGAARSPGALADLWFAARSSRVPGESPAAAG